MRVLFFPSSSDFRRWLKTNHKEVSKLWVGFYKKSSGRSSITYPEALDEALCFGWIDGVRKSVDADAYLQRFTPRQPKSRWSAVNIRRAETLLAQGRMHPAGLKAFEGAKNKHKNQPQQYSAEQRQRATLDKAAERQFRGHPKAWEFFERQAPWYRRICAFWILSAKKEETRKKRLSTLIADSGRGELVKPLRRPAVPKRTKKMQ
jgi:uncharacterized protein YdeI (YjbR/CyaY-like superfamily)